MLSGSAAWAPSGAAAQTAGATAPTAPRLRVDKPDPAQSFQRRSGAELMRLILATPAGMASVRMAEKHGVKVQRSLQAMGPQCLYPGCIEATPQRPSQYYEGWKLWAQDVVWEGNTPPSIYLRAGAAGPAPVASGGERRPRVFFLIQRAVPAAGATWFAITFDVCRGWPTPAPRYDGRVRARVLQGMVPFAHNPHVSPSAEAELGAFDSDQFPGSREACFSMPVLARIRPQEPGLSTNAFVLELQQGELSLVRATARPL